MVSNLRRHEGSLNIQCFRWHFSNKVSFKSFKSSLKPLLTKSASFFMSANQRSLCSQHGMVWLNSVVTILSSSITRTKTHFQPSSKYKSRDKLILHPQSPANQIRHQGSHTNQNSVLCSYNLIRIGCWSSTTTHHPQYHQHLGTAHQWQA